MQRILTITAVALGAATSRAQTTLWSETAAQTSSYEGCAIAGNGNLDNDVYPDFLVGHYGNRPQDDQKGGGRVVYGGWAMGVDPHAPLQLDPYGGNAPDHVPGDHLGQALAFFGDANGDGRTDYAVGAPYSDSGAGRVYFYRASMVTASTLAGAAAGDRFGFAIAPAGDVNHDGKPDVIVSAPYADSNGTNSGIVHVYSGGAVLQLGGTLELLTLDNGSADSLFGYSVAGGTDVNRDGWSDILVGVPGDALFGATVGTARLYSGHDGSQLELLGDGVANGGFGQCVCMPGDLNGDMYPDLIVGARDNDEQGTNCGKVIVYSGKALTLNQTPRELYVLYGSTGSHFGQALSGCGDVNGDGYNDFVVGAPYFDSLIGPSERGAAYVYSGRSGLLIAARFGTQASEHLGSAVAGAGDVDRDGYPDILVGSPHYDGGATNGGKVELWSIFPTATRAYCTGKTNSAGCVPVIASQGTPDYNSTAAFQITGINFLNQKNGLLFFGFAPNATAFQGGTLCVAQPVVRTIVQSSGGSASGTDCTGHYSYDFNALIRSHSNPLLLPGTEVCAQYWARDPGSASTTSLSNALHFTIDP